MTDLSKRVLNRLEINIKDNESSQIYKFYQDWLKMVQMKEEIDIKPNVIEFDFLPGYRFKGLRFSEHSDSNPLNVNFTCDSVECDNDVTVKFIADKWTSKI